MKKDKAAHVLLVEDDEVFRKVMSFTLESRGYLVFQARSGYEAISILKTQNIDLVISDLVMQNGDGFLLSNHLKRTHPEIPLIICSGYLFESRDMLLVDGPAALVGQPLLDKPFNRQQLFKVLESTLLKDQRA